MEPYYEAGGITLYCGDNREVLPQLRPAFDLVFTSPPYNLGLSPGGGTEGGRFYNPSRNGRGRRFIAGYGEQGDAIPWPDYEAWQRDTLSRCWSLLSDRGAIYYNHKPRIRHKQLWTPLDLNPGLPLRQIVTWDRRGGINLGDGHYAPASEWLMLFAKDGFRLASRQASAIGDVWRIPFETEGWGHPAPFPVALPTRALVTTGAASVLDPHAGTGSTLRAAKNLGLRAVGIEREERWCEVAVARLAQEALPLGA